MTYIILQSDKVDTNCFSCNPIRTLKCFLKTNNSKFYDSFICKEAYSAVKKASTLLLLERLKQYTIKHPRASIYVA